MSAIITAADIAAYAPELDLSMYNATTLSGMCNMATKRAEQFASVDGFTFQTVTNETDAARISNAGELIISVRRRPIASVASISLIKGGFSTSLVLTDQSNGTPLYQVPAPANMLVFPNSYFYLTGTYLAGGSSQLYTLRGANMMYQMTYQGGYQMIPDDLKYAAILYFRDAYSKRTVGTNGGVLTGFTQGSYSEHYAPNATGRSTFVQEAEDVLMNGGYCRLEF